MFGNILSNAQIHKLVKEQTITIRPWHPERLKLAHYSLRPGGVWKAGAINAKGNRDFTPLHDFNNSDEYVLGPGEYVIIEVNEYVWLPEGIVGHFLPVSALIEQGFALVAGKLDPGYGAVDGKRQKIIFGLKNLRDEDNVYSAAGGIAHMYLVDLRGLSSLPVEFNEAEIREFLDRFPRFKRAYDDGPFYPQ